MISPCDLPRGERSERVKSGEDLQLFVFEDTLQDSVWALARELHIHGARIVSVCVCVQRSGPRLSQVPPEHVQLVAAVPVIVYRYYPGLAIPPALSCR